MQGTVLTTERGFHCKMAKPRSSEERADMRRNKKMTGGPRGGPSWLQQALNLSELRFPPLSKEGPAVGMISGHSASSKTL